MKIVFRQRNSSTSWQFLLVSILIIWLGFGSRLHNLAGDSFWEDEITTVRTVESGLGSLVSQRDHPPMMYVLTYLSMNIYGENEFAARLPSMMASMLAIPLIILVGRWLDLPAAGFWAALLLILTPFQLRQSQMARNYALLMTFSLASFVALFNALQRPRWTTWILFAGVSILNLYTHYGSLIVFATQGLFVAGWYAKEWFRGNKRIKNWLFALIAGFVVILLYIPWLSRLRQALEANVGETTITGTGVSTPPSLWIQRAFANFSLDNRLFPYFILGLAIIGLLVLAWRRNWLGFGLIVASIVLPFILIGVSQVARGPLPRYIIYILPIYFLLSGVGLAAILQRVSRVKFGNLGRVILSAGLVITFIIIGWPGLQSEYGFIPEDWRGIVDYLNDQADDGDVVVAMTLNYNYGHNRVRYSMPYYLNKTEREYELLEGTSLDLEDVSNLTNSDVDIWVVVSDRAWKTALREGPFEVLPFQTGLYVVRLTDQNGSTLEKLIDVYENLIPLTSELQQGCLLRLDAAAIYAGNHNLTRLEQELAYIEKQCPGLEYDNRIEEVNFVLLQNELEEAVQSNRTKKARSLAARILEIDDKQPRALEVLTAVNLLTLFENGQAVVTNDVGPEPVSETRFTMPKNGDWGDALLVHPPAAVHYQLSLPDEALSFRSRVALAPESWDWNGDGATFVLTIQTDTGEPIELYRHHVSNEPGDRKWHDSIVSLSDYAGEDVILTLRTEEGPVGDGTGDWAGWETPRLMYSSLEFQ